MPKKKTKEQILNKLDERNLIHPSIVPLSDFDYINTYQKIEWCCENLHTFESSFKNILNGHGCKKCTMISMTTNNIIAVEIFLDRLEEKNKNTTKKVYINDINEYCGMTKPIHWHCDKEHVWKTTPKSVIQNNTYCKICANQENGTNQTSTINTIKRKLVERNNKLPNKKVLLNDDSYINNKTPMNWMCTTGHKWKIPPDSIFNALSSCPICARAGFSHKAISWLDAIAYENNIYIQHALNGGEYKIPNSRYKADGFCKETNTIYEFYGDEFHGNPLTRDPNKVSSLSKILYGELYKKTMEREEFIRDNGYNLITIWENFYDNYDNI